MTLRQSHFVPPVSYLLAAELGFLRDVEVVPTRTPSSAEQLRALLAGEQDMVVTAIDNLFEWTRAGADLRLVAQVEQTTPLGIHARGDVESLADLAGCRFAVDAPDNGFALIAKRLLRDAGVEVDYVVVGGVRERLDALLGGQVDATLLGPPFDKLAEKAGFARVVDVNALLPELPGQGLVVRAELLDSEELERYLVPWYAEWRPESRWPMRRASSCLNAAATKPRPRAPGARAPARLQWITAGWSC